MARKKTTETDDTPLVFDLTLSDTTLAGMVSRRFEEAKGHWEKKYNLNKIRQENKKLYTSEYIQKVLRDDRYEEIFNHNKNFVAIRTILPFITSNMTQPEITPVNANDLSRRFAQDYEKILVEEANQCYARDKVKLALQDLLAGQRIGVLKWVYNPNKEKLSIEHIDPDSIVVGKRSRLREEPDVQHTQERTIGDMVRQFPEKKDAIYKLFDIQKGVPSQLERVEKMTENWIWVEEEDELKLAVVFMIGNSLVLGKMSDPNWIDGGKNLLDEHKSPFIFFNFLNDGSGYIDQTSFIEQAQYVQKQYDKRGSTIAENAAYGGTGVPVFGKGAVKEETAAKVKFSPVHRIMLDIEDVSKGFTTWQADPLPQYIVEDKKELEMNILDIWGSNQIQTGLNANSQTLGQDVMLRNQAEGRQQELVDCVDNAMSRFYELEAQLIYRYFDETKYYNFIGDDGEFEQIAISQDKIAKNIGIKIKIKSGSSLPVDRSQKIAQAIELAKMKKIGTLRLYKELGVENPEEAYKEYLRENILPFSDLGDMDSKIFNREADEDLQLVIAGKTPKEREDIGQEYLTHLQEYLLTQKYEQLPQSAQQKVSQFVAEVIAQAKRKMLKMSMMKPILPESSGQLPPIRPKFSFSGRDLEPDVRAQLLQNAGYKPSVLTNMELAAGMVTPPIERETIQGNPLQGQAPAPAQPVQQ